MKLLKKNLTLSVIEKVVGENVLDIRKAKDFPIIKRLETIHANLAETVGRNDPLFLLTGMALDTGKRRYLKVAEAAYQSQAYRFRRAVENGWVPLNEAGQCRMLRIQGNEDGDGEVWFDHELTEVPDFAEDGYALPDVGIYIAEGTPKRVALEILKKGIDQISKEWEVMVKEVAKSA
jgi:hypothetical protein